MEQEAKINTQEIMEKIAKIQADIEYIKSHMNFKEDKELEKEMNIWEEASAEDSEDFFEQHHL